MSFLDAAEVEICLLCHECGHRQRHQRVQNLHSECWNLCCILLVVKLLDARNIHVFEVVSSSTIRRKVEATLMRTTKAMPRTVKQYSRPAPLDRLMPFQNVGPFAAHFTPKSFWTPVAAQYSKQYSKTLRSKEFEITGQEVEGSRRKSRDKVSKLSDHPYASEAGAMEDITSNSPLGRIATKSSCTGRAPTLKPCPERWAV